MNYKDNRGTIKAILCSAINSLATAPDLRVLFTASLSAEPSKSAVQGRLSLHDQRHRTSVDVNPLPDGSS